MSGNKYIFSSYAFSFIKEARKISEATGYPFIEGRYNPFSVSGSGLILANPDTVGMNIIRITQRVSFSCYLVLEGIIRYRFLVDFYNRFPVYVPSEFVRECLEASGIHVDKVIPHGIPKVHGREIVKREKPRLLYIAWWHNWLPRKYPREAIEGLRLVKEPFELTVLTSKNNPYVKELSKYGRVITKVGELSENELLKLYQSHDFYLSMSNSEGFGVPVLEALSCALPVIHVDARPFNEITTPECSFRFPYEKVVEHPCPYFQGLLHKYSPEAFAEAVSEAIRTYLYEFDKYRAMCMCALAVAQRYTYKFTYEAFRELI